MIWHEWLCHSNFSFLLGASHPEDYVLQAGSHDYDGIGICDFDGVYGIVRAHCYWQQQKMQEQMKIYYGAELHLAADHHLATVQRDSIVLKARTLQGYHALCRIINQSHQHSKHEPYITPDDLLQLPADGLIAIQPMRGLIRSATQLKVEERYELWRQHFGEYFFLAISRHLHPLEDCWIEPSLKIAQRMQIPTLLSQDAFFHKPQNKDLCDLLQAIRLNRPVDECVPYFFVNQERCLLSKSQLKRRYRDIPGFAACLDRSQQLANSFQFSLDQLQYQYPQEMIPAGFSSQSYLEFLVWQEGYRRYPNPSSKLINTLQRELQLIAHLGFADYFLTVWDIVRWARAQGILCQGRGSAANSAICFVLGITSVDPALFDLLFERFMSVERGDPPDIDVDFEHERREEVIQYIYERYGRHRAAMVANVISFRRRGAIRAVGKALGVPEQTLQEAAKLQDLRIFRRQDAAQSLSQLQSTDTVERHHSSIPWELWADLAERLQGFPRHMGIHSGGFVISHHSLDHIVPQEPASMPGRTVIQWNKDDLEALNLFKIDVLALGMLTMIRKCFGLIQQHDQLRLDMSSIPQEDPKTYQMIQRAETVGTFQIESRAQMSMLPRLRPKTFYDLVVQVGIIRPGPIQGGLIHPYLRRRDGLEAITYPHPKLESILKRTLGVPIFQEQIMRMAMAVGDFHAGEADQLRQQLGSWALNKDLNPLITKLEQGMRRHKIHETHIQQSLAYLRGFADYGFPESHAVSFALLAYVSSYLKCHFPAAFYTALLNSQPMGFYSAHALLRSAQRDGIRILAISITHSNWDHQLEVLDGESSYAIRLGFRLVKGLSHRGAQELVARRKRRRWQSLAEFLPDQALHRGDLTALAAANAFREWGLDRSAAIWVAEAAPFASLLEEELQHQFPIEDALDSIEQDFAAFGSTLGTHPAQLIKQRYWSYQPKLGKLSCAKGLQQGRNGQFVTVFGMVLVRQSPPTAKGMSFFTLEDETGFINLAFPPQLGERYRSVINSQGFLCVSGKLQLAGHSHSILVHSVHSVQAPRPNIIPLHNRDWIRHAEEHSTSEQKTLVRARNYM